MFEVLDNPTMVWESSVGANHDEFAKRLEAAIQKCHASARGTSSSSTSADARRSISSRLTGGGCDGQRLTPTIPAGVPTVALTEDDFRVRIDPAFRKLGCPPGAQSPRQVNGGNGDAAGVSATGLPNPTTGQPADLEALVKAWPTLPRLVRDAIVRIVAASRPK